MLHTLWSVKGGSGVSVAAAALGDLLARREGRAVVVDLCGDQPAVMGMLEPSGPGVLDWLATADGTAEAVQRLLLPVDGLGLELLPRGRDSGDLRADRGGALIDGLAGLGCPVVVDAGPFVHESTRSSGASPLAQVAGSLASGGRSTLVTRSCYLSLRRAQQVASLADSVALLLDAGRALGAGDVARLLGIDRVARMDVDPAVARSVDSGLLVRRRPLDRAIGSLV